MASDVITARGLVKTFGGIAALDGIDLDIGRGEICALLGRNGAGKSTLIHCALGLLRPSAGEVLIFGERPGALRARRRTGVMLQDADLPDALSAREHLALFATGYPAPVSVDALIGQTAISEFADRRYGSLSGGQKRRVQLAVSLVGNPDLLFLDEPTTGLDAEARRAVWRNVRALADRGTTVVLTTHYLEEADALADRIVVLSDGRIIADGEAEAVRSRTGGALISCRTQVPAEVVAGMPAVRSVTQQGRLLAILTDEPAVTLAELLRADPALSDLAVRRPTLEEAFEALTATAREAA